MTTVQLEPTTEPLHLASLPERINAEHNRCVTAVTDAIVGAIEVGRLLAEARSQVGHGQWAGWVATNCSFKMRQCQNYLRAYRERDKLEDQIRSGSAYLGSLNAAMSLLAEPRIKTLDPTEKDELARLESIVDRGVAKIADQCGSRDLALRALSLHAEKNGLFDESDLPNVSTSLMQNTGGPGRQGTPFMQRDERSRHWLCSQWWTDRARYCLMLDAAGWDVAEIAQFLGQPIIAIQAILDPTPPIRFDCYENGLFINTDMSVVTAYFANEVARGINASLMDAYERAAEECSANGFGHAKPILEAGHRRHLRRVEASTVAGYYPVSYMAGDADGRTSMLLWACALRDSRWAIRCGSESEGRDTPPTMLEDWAAVEESIETRKANEPVPMRSNA